MRSATTFIIFGVLLIGVLVLSKVNQQSNANSPAAIAVKTFLQGIAKNDDADKVKSVLDMKRVKVVTAGKKVTSINFGGGSVFQGAFSQAPSVLWSYGDLTNLALDPRSEAVIDKESGLATFICQNGVKIYLHTMLDDSAADPAAKEAGWKIFYIVKPKEEGQ